MCQSFYIKITSLYPCAIQSVTENIRGYSSSPTRLCVHAICCVIFQTLSKKGQGVFS